MLTVSYILVGLAIGMISGAVGIGGGVLLIPALMWLFGFGHREAIGTTLGVLVPPVGLLAARQYYLNNLMDLHAAVAIAISFALGAWLGAAVMHHIPLAAVRIFFGSLLIYVGIRFVVASDRNVAAAVWGLSVLALTWLAFFALRAFGRRYQPRRARELIQQWHEENPNEPEYYI